MMTGAACPLPGRHPEMVAERCGLAARVMAICLLAFAGCGRSQDASCRVDAAGTGGENVDSAGIADANADRAVLDDAAAMGETAQPCDNALVWKGDYVIASLADLERLRGYTSLSGSLVIASDGLVNLHGLECLHTVDGSVEIGRCPLAGTSPEPPCASNASLTSLEGLGIVYVRASFSVHHAPLLRDLHGLENLRSASQTSIAHLPALRSVAGLQDIKFGAWIHIYDNPLLEDLSPFAGKGLGGSLLLSDNTALASLKGLENATVMQSFEIRSSPSLSSLDALNLYYVYGDVVIQDMGQIVDLSGLEALTHVGTLSLVTNASLANVLALSKLRQISELVVRGNPSLTSLAGLSIGATSLKSVEIADNWRLSDLAGFEQVTQMGYLRVEGNRALTSLEGLANLVAVGDRALNPDGAIYIDNNDVLTSMDGLRALARVDGAISVQGNAALRDVAVLERITFSGPSLTFVNNRSLPTCQARRVSEAQAAKGWTGDVRICGNLPDECEGTPDCGLGG